MRAVTAATLHNRRCCKRTLRGKLRDTSIPLTIGRNELRELGAGRSLFPHVLLFYNFGRMLVSQVLDCAGLMNTEHRIVVLTEGHSNPHTAKTACSVIRYRGADVAAVLDSSEAGKRSGELLGVGDVPVIAQLSEVSEATALLLGIAPPGGKIPASWRPIIFEAIERGMDIISGLHDFLIRDEEFVAAAQRHNVQLIDVRRNSENTIARRQGLNERCFRLHTVGHDCSIGKMVTAIELTRGLDRRGRKAKFIATGQTGIMVAGDGCPIDCVVADFVSGAAEKMILAHQDQHEFLVVEGQGSLVHPSYSAVTLGLLHGCFPHALILCYEVGRETITGLEHLRIPPLAKIRELNEIMAGLFHPCPVIGVAMNSRKVSPEEAERERTRVRGELGLPVCDIFRHGCEELLDAVEQEYKKHQERLGG